MSDIQLISLIAIAFVSGISYYAGHHKGISNTVDYLEAEGVLEFEE